MLKTCSKILLLIVLTVTACSMPIAEPTILEPLGLVTPTKTVVSTTVSKEGGGDSAESTTVSKQTQIILPTMTTPPLTTDTTPDVQRWTVSANAGVPSTWQAAVEQLPDFTPISEKGDVQLAIRQGEIIAYATYALVVPLYSFTESATQDEVRQRWLAEVPQLAGSTETLTAFSQIWGHSGAGVLAIDNPDQLADRVWAQDDVWGIVPLMGLSAEYKTLAIDGQSPLDPKMDANTYLLRLPIGAVSKDGQAVAQLQKTWQPAAFEWQPERFTRVAMTGVTALVRATAFRMEQNGILWPGEEVREVLNSADIAHLSNEVAFVKDCPYPSFVGGTRFCSDIRYFELIQDLSIDVMELTGNHVNDYGADAFARSIQRYVDAGMKYFGGGVNSADAQTAAIFNEDNGNRIAFLGCNPVGPSYAWAGESSAGSRPCDPELESRIRELAADGVIVIMTLQYHEHYFYQPTHQQQLDFRRYVDAGASIVSGSQGHHVQGFDLYGDGFIHYGLGNLFFDQMQMLGTRQVMIDEYIIYNGQLVGVEFTTGLIEDYARPRLMSADEEQQLFQTLFDVSTR